MPLHIDIPTHEQVSRLFETIGPRCVSIYLPTEPTSPGQAERIALKNLVAEAVDAGREGGASASPEKRRSMARSWARAAFSSSAVARAFCIRTRAWGASPASAGPKP